MTENENWVDLGFAEENRPASITNRYFPSKIGGKPAWLELKNLPKADELKCEKCNEPRVFLCQIYAPIESREDCFHRTIFVFICRNEQCEEVNSSSNIVAFRSQLPQKNIYFSSDPPDVNKTLPAIPPLVRLCSICGCHGPLLCSQCKKVSYCGSCHQKIDWKYHKNICKSNAITESDTKCNILFPELEIVIEPGPQISSNSKDETEKDAEERRLQEYEELLKSGAVGELKDVSESELVQYTSTANDDKYFSKFKKRISLNPEQVLRYERCGQPLWITSKVIPNEDVPKCENCGSKRTFELQIMPQFLYVIKEEKLDWGTIAIYTCQASCDPNSGYVREFVVKQDIIGESNKAD